MSRETTTFDYSHDVNMEFDQNAWIRSVDLTLQAEGYIPLTGETSYDEEENTLKLIVRCSRQPEK